MTSETAVKNKGGRPRNVEREKLERKLGVSARRVQQIIKEQGLDRITDEVELRMIERRVVIAYRSEQAARVRYESDRQKQLDAHELISVDDANAIYLAALMELKAQLANIPDRLCGKLTPDDPEHSRRILQDELVSISDAVIAAAQRV
jgi:hypothetical protein